MEWIPITERLPGLNPYKTWYGDMDKRSAKILLFSPRNNLVDVGYFKQRFFGNGLFWTGKYNSEWATHWMEVTFPSE